MNFQNLLPTLFAASHLQINTLLSTCSKFLLENLNLSNCASILKIADFFMLREIAELTRQFVGENVLNLYENGCSQICQLSYDQLQDLMATQHVNRLCELDLFLMLAKWLQTPSEEVCSFMD